MTKHRRLGDSLLAEIIDLLARKDAGVGELSIIVPGLLVLTIKNADWMAGSPRNLDTVEQSLDRLKQRILERMEEDGWKRQHN